MLFLFKLEVNVFNLDIIFTLYFICMQILIKRSNVARIYILETGDNGTLKQGWMLKRQDSLNFFEK